MSIYQLALFQYKVSEKLNLLKEMNDEAVSKTFLGNEPEILNHLDN